jgi:hypothetical protein
MNLHLILSFFSIYQWIPCLFLIQPIFCAHVGDHQRKFRAPAQEKNPQEKKWFSRDISGHEHYDIERSVPTTVEMKCSYNGHPICCLITDDNYEQFVSSYSPKARSEFFTSRQSSSKNCRITKKEYFPSAYELKHLEKAKEITLKEDYNERRKLYGEFIFQDLPHTIQWMNRVKERMLASSSSGSETPVNSVDKEYLSRFHYEVTCEGGSSSSSSWDDWIEPLTVYGRHPYGIVRCAHDMFEMKADGTMLYHPLGGGETKTFEKPIPWTVSKESRDYLLLSSSSSQLYSATNNFPNTYLFDIGSKEFPSSLSWLTCGYLQKNISFSSIYAWEYRKIDPPTYWNSVPKTILPYMHWINAPISEDIKAHHSFDRVIRQIAKKDDFVAVKLDVDHPYIELPTVLRILQDSSLHNVIDELFFELHFNCEFMTGCGWGSPDPSPLMKLDRGSAMTLFQDLRKVGIRAHMWP